MTPDEEELHRGWDELREYRIAIASAYEVARPGAADVWRLQSSHLAPGPVPGCLSELGGDVREFPLNAVNPGYVYFLLDGGQVAYVGKSIDLRSRIERHHDLMPAFDRVLFIEVDARRLDEVERYWIAKLNPAWNKYGTDGFRRSSSPR